MKEETIYVIGDIHSDWKNVFEKIKYYDLRNCILISVGDIGIGFIPSDKQSRQLNLINDFFQGREIKFLGIRGNHDDPDYFNGEVNLSNVRLLPDYHTEVINECKFLFVGGAISIDRTERLSGKSYWENEKFNLREDLVSECDILITHSAPVWNGPIDKTGLDYWIRKDVSLWSECLIERRGHSRLIELAKPKKHYCGHFHISSIIDNIGCESRILDILEIVIVRTALS